MHFTFGDLELHPLFPVPIARQQVPKIDPVVKDFLMNYKEVVLRPSGVITTSTLPKVIVVSASGVIAPNIKPKEVVVRPCCVIITRTFPNKAVIFSKCSTSS